MRKTLSPRWCAIATTLCATLLAGVVTAQTKKTREPVFRVAKNTKTEESDSTEKAPAKLASTSRTIENHPLTPCIDTAKEGLTRIRKELMDYEGLLVKRERINGILGDTEFIKFKIRNERVVDGKTVPFSVYMRFLKPSKMRGQEVIWVEGKNKGKLIAHGNPHAAFGGITVKLDPDGAMAMKGNKYPIYDVGIENLVQKLITKATRDRAAGDCVVEIRENAKIAGRPCKMIQLTHPEKKAPFEFYKAQVFIDKELDLPVRYAAWDWPTKNGKPKLLEEYTYVQLKTNVGLTDEDFNHKNSKYDY